MRTMWRRILGVALVIMGVVVLVGSTTVVDVPGPMAPSKSEFVFNFSVPFTALAVVLAVAGIFLLVHTWKKTGEPCVS